MTPNDLVQNTLTPECICTIRRVIRMMLLFVTRPLLPPIHNIIQNLTEICQSAAELQNKDAQPMPGKRATVVCVWSLFCHLTVVWRPLAEERLAISTQSVHSGLQFCRWQYGSVFIRLAVIVSETREMSRNSKRIWPYSSSRSSNVIDLGVNGKPICDFLLVINCIFSHICYRFWDIHV